MNLLLYIYIYIYFDGIKIKDKSLEGLPLREYIQIGLGVKPHLNSQQCFNEDLILLILKKNNNNFNLSAQKYF